MSALRFIFLLSATAYIVSGQRRGDAQQGDLRFGGSFADGASGRLEVFIDNQWGTICIDGFNKRSADTACRQLGSFEALTFGEADSLGYGQGSGQIHITELECSRNDIHILHCNIRDRLQCDHSSDVAVICSIISAFQFDGGMRLLNGPYRSEGLLELYFFRQWGGVCGRSFDMIAANAVCIALGYTGSKSLTFVSRFENMSSPVWVNSSSINCASSRTCFSNCYSDPTMDNDLSSLCSNDYVYLNCEFVGVANSRCLATPFDPTPNGGDFGVGGSLEDSEEEDGLDQAAVAGIIIGSFFGFFILLALMIFVIFCCCILCDNEDNGNTSTKGDTYTPNQELEDIEMAAMNEPSSPQLNINQELEELEMAAMNEPSNPQSNINQELEELEMAAMNEPSSPQSNINQELEELEMAAMNEPSNSQSNINQELEELEMAAMNEPSSPRSNINQELEELEQAAMNEPSNPQSNINQELEELEQAAMNEPSNPRSNINQELAELEQAAMNEPSSLRSNTNQELEELEVAAMNEPSKSSSSSSDSEDGDQKGNIEPPDDQHPHDTKASEKEDDAKSSSPSYDTVV